MSHGCISRSMSERSRAAITAQHLTEVRYGEKDYTKKIAPRGRRLCGWRSWRGAWAAQDRGRQRDGGDKKNLRMLGKDALPKVERMSPSRIVAAREKTGVSQAIMAALPTWR
jgi:hypothetical protein